MVASVRREPPDQPAVRALIAALDAYQDSLYPPEARYALDIGALMQPAVVFMVARCAQGRAIGCGAVVPGAGGSGELKRLYVDPAQRSQGVARRIMQALEAAAWQAGCRVLQLETGPYQPEALAFYQRLGYRRCGPFGGYPEHPLSVFMAKPLAAPEPG